MRPPLTGIVFFRRTRYDTRMTKILHSSDMWTGSRPANRFGIAGLTLALMGAFSSFASQIECPEPIYDFGEKPETEIVTHVFTIRNTGRTPLLINDIRETCGCTVTRAADSRIPPGGVSSVETKLSLRGRRGPQRHQVIVLSSDPDKPKLALVMTGRVFADVSLKPPQVFLGRVGPDSNEPRILDLTVEGDRPVQVLRVTSDADWVEGSFLPGESANGSGRVQLQFRSPLPEGLIHATIRVETDHPKVPVLTLPVGAYVKAVLPVTEKEESR